MVCTGKAASVSQSAAIHAARASRSSVAAFTLISSCAFERAVHLGDDGVGKPLVADHHDGARPWAWARQFAAAGGGQGGHAGIMTRFAREGVGEALRLEQGSGSGATWNDPYVQRSKREGYRSRSAYQAHRDRRPRPDPGPRRGGRGPGRRTRRLTQVATKRVGPKGRVVAIDLLEMEAVPGATFIRGDFSTDRGLADVEASLGGARADACSSDMAPNLSGIAISDQARSMGAGGARPRFRPLAPETGGAFLVKVFQGAGYEEFHRSLRAGSTRSWCASPRRPGAKAPSFTCWPGGRRRRNTPLSSHPLETGPDAGTLL